MLCLPLAASAQSILLTADNFALLGGTAITVAGAGPTTIANGNVGLSSAAESNITGFPPATITGGSILTTGGVTSQAGTDLITARNGLAGMPSDTNLSNVDLGGLTLAPGVYTFDAAAALTGALTLDAEGQNNAFWVFQIGTALTTAVNSTVTMINLGTNGGSDTGIFWNAGAEIVVGDSNTMLGNLISGTSITFGINADFSGRALAGAAVSFSGAAAQDVFGGPDGSSYNGGLTYDGLGNVVPVAAVPEPAAVLWLTPLGALGFVIWRKRAGRANPVG